MLDCGAPQYEHSIRFASEACHIAGPIKRNLLVSAFRY